MYQIEFTVKNSEAAQQAITAIRKHKISNILLTDKDSKVDNISIAQEIQKKFPNLQITLVFSVEKNYTRDVDQLLDTFQEFVIKALTAGISKILIISGSNRRQLNSMDLFCNIEKILEENTTLNSFRAKLEFACAYNPYLKNEDLVEENERLKRKLKSSKLVKNVYFQIGDDIQSLKRGFDFVKNIRQNVDILGCLLIPNNHFLEKFKKYPIRGINLSKNYIKKLTFAFDQTSLVFDFYLKHGITPLVEVIPFNEQYFDEAIDFFYRLKYDSYV